MRYSSFIISSQFDFQAFRCYSLLSLMFDRKGNSVSNVCLSANKQDFLSFSRVSSCLLWPIIIASNLRSSDHPERKYMLKCIVYGLRKPLILFVVHLSYFNRRLTRITNTAIFCIQKLKGLFHPAFLARVVSWLAFVCRHFHGP